MIFLLFVGTLVANAHLDAAVVTVLRKSYHKFQGRTEDSVTFARLKTLPLNKHVKAAEFVPAVWFGEGRVKGPSVYNILLGTIYPQAERILLTEAEVFLRECGSHSLFFKR